MIIDITNSVNQHIKLYILFIQHNQQLQQTTFLLPFSIFHLMITAKTVTTNFFWRFFERCGAQLVSFVVSIILARLLEPSVYGEIALITVFTCILQVFIDSALSGTRDAYRLASFRHG